MMLCSSASWGFDAALKYSVQIRAALDHAHKKGITHRI
jgi:hypothetical protein